MAISRKQLGLTTLTLILGGGVGWVSHQALANRLDRATITTNEEAAVTTLATNPPTTPERLGATAIPQNNPNFIADAVERVGAAVVRIDSENTNWEVPDAFQNPFFRRFFGMRCPFQKDLPSRAPAPAL
jgi:S1-C subfamily serine protease